MTKDKAMITIASITAIVIAALIVVWLLSLGPVQIEKQPTTTLVIEGPDAIEIGERVSYSLTMDGALCYTGFPQVDWKINQGGQVMSQDGAEIILMAHQPGRIILTASFSGLSAQKVIDVYPRASLSFNMDTWIHREWEFTGIVFSGTAEPSLKLYKVLETGRRVDVSSGTWETYGFSELIIREYGNYLLIAESRALSDGRLVSAEKALTVTPYVQRGYHQFDWDREDLVQLTKADKMAIRFFLEEELGIEVGLISEGKLRDANRVSTDYVFYKDSGRGDTLLYQTVVSSKGMVRKMWQTSVKGLDGRYVYISWDDFIVSANTGSPGTSMVSSYRDSGSGSSGGGSSGGGPMPSPPIGG